MLKHEEMIENVHRRIAQYEEEKKLQQSKFKNIFSAIKQKNNEEEYTEVVNGTERIDTSRRTLRIISTIAASAVLVTGIGATSVLLHKNNSLKPTVTNEENDLNEYETSTLSDEIICDSPFEGILNSPYNMLLPSLEITESMREKITEFFNSQKGWKVADNYSRFLHEENGGAYSPLTQRLVLAYDIYYLQICDDNIIEYSVCNDNSKWEKTFYECDSFALINGIAEIIESEITENELIDYSVDFDDDVSGYNVVEGTSAPVELTPIQQTLLRLCMKSYGWLVEKAEADRFYDLSFVNEGVGTIGIIGENTYYIKNGTTYLCDSPGFSSNIRCIMSKYDYPDVKLNISIYDAKKDAIISTDDKNDALLANFIYNDLPSMTISYDNDPSENTNSTKKYHIDVSYKSGDTKLRSVSFSISSLGDVERLDYVLDSVYGWSPAGCMYYTLDLSEFEHKLDELINNKQSEKTPENKKDTDKKDKNNSESVQPTTQKEDKPENNDEQPQVKPTINEKQEVETTTKAEPTEPTNPNEQNLGDPHKYYDDSLAPTPHVIIDYELPDYTYTSVASCITHDNNALDDFVANVFVPMLELKDYKWSPDRYAKYNYTIYRIYETEKNYMGIPAKYMIRDGYYIGDNDCVSLCSYIYFNGDWEPCGAENFSFDYAKFEELLKETLNSSKLPDEQKES